MSLFLELDICLHVAQTNPVSSCVIDVWSISFHAPLQATSADFNEVGETSRMEYAFWYYIFYVSKYILYNLWILKFSVCG